MSDAVGSVAPEEQSEECPAVVRVTWTPFGLYLAAWVALAAASAYLLRGATAESPARWMPEYPGLLWVSIMLVGAGPVLSFVVWLVVRGKHADGHRQGLLASAMMRGALAAVLGVMIWFGTLYAIEVMMMNGALG